MALLELLPEEWQSMATLPRKRWTREECRWLVASGKLEAGKYELIYGEIVFKMPQGRLHVFVLTRLIQILLRLFGEDRIQSQAPVVISDYNEPEPDVAVLRGHIGDYLDREPGPEDALLIVEVSDTTLRSDRLIKARLYAQASVPEYWIANIPDCTLIVHRDPTENGYASVRTLSVAEEITPLSATEAIPVAALFPPMTAEGESSP